MFVEKTNVELLVPARGRLQFNLFTQRIFIVRPFAQHGAKHMQLVGKKHLCASFQLYAQNDVEAGRAQQQQQQASERVGRRQPECQGPEQPWRGRRAMFRLQGHSRHREPCESASPERDHPSCCATSAR